MYIYMFANDKIVYIVLSMYIDVQICLVIIGILWVQWTSIGIVHFSVGFDGPVYM